MLQVLIGTILFLLGFMIGVFERKIDRVKINKQVLRQVFKISQSEVLQTPPELTDEEKAIAKL